MFVDGETPVTLTWRELVVLISLTEHTQQVILDGGEFPGDDDSTDTALNLEHCAELLEKFRTSIAKIEKEHGV